MLHRKIVHYVPIAKYITTKNVVAQPGGFVSYLYEVFITKEQKFDAAVCRILGFCPDEVNFLTWIKTLESHKLIKVIWDTPYRYKYINIGPYLLDKWKCVMVSTQGVATKTDIYEIQENIANLHQIIEALALKVGVPYDPPDFKELRRYLYKDIEAPF